MSTWPELNTYLDPTFIVTCHTPHLGVGQVVHDAAGRADQHVRPLAQRDGLHTALRLRAFGALYMPAGTRGRLPGAKACTKNDSLEINGSGISSGMCASLLREMACSKTHNVS